MYVLQLTDSAGAHSVAFRLDEKHLDTKAIDIVFDVVGADPEVLKNSNVISAEQTADVRALQKEIFDQDSQGRFIRDSVRITTQGKDIDPDRPLREAFEANGNGASKCDAKLEKLSGEDIVERMEKFGRMFLLHQVAEGAPLDVTVDHPEIQSLLAWAEAEQLIEIDVKKAAYKLTEKGKRQHQRQLDEAQELIRRYDIYSDVDVDAEGKVHFDTKLGADLRVPIYEMEGVDPFRARFMIGLNDGEFRESDWTKMALSEAFYKEVFTPIETAPSISEIGDGKLTAILQEGKKVLRADMRMPQGGNGFDYEHN